MNWVDKMDKDLSIQMAVWHVDHHMWPLHRISHNNIVALARSVPCGPRN